MFQSKKILDNVLHLNFAPNYTCNLENINDIENTNYSFQFLCNSRQDLKVEHLLANNNNYVSERFNITEWDLYGSSRLGTRNVDKSFDVIIIAGRSYNWVNNTVTNENIGPTQSFTYKKYRVLGAKTFELTNHLGNVITTISDRKLMVEDQQTPGYVHHYKPEILSIGEQYAFGMSMPGRTFSVEDYRYGFNGKENQDELLGEDNAQDFGARMYDARVGRWWGLDQKRVSFPSISPYCGLADNPILFVDPDGKANTIYLAFTKYGYEQFFGNGALNLLPLQVMMKELEDAVNAILGDGNVVQVKFLPEGDLSPSGLDPSDAIIVLGSISEIIKTADGYFDGAPPAIAGFAGAWHSNPEVTWLNFVCIDISENGNGMQDVADDANFTSLPSAIVFFMLHGIGHTTGWGGIGGHTNEVGGGGWGKNLDEKVNLMNDGTTTINLLQKERIRTLKDFINDPNNILLREQFKEKFKAKKPSDNYSNNLKLNMWKGQGHLHSDVKTPVKRTTPARPKTKPNNKPNNKSTNKPKNKTPHRPKF